MTDQPTRRTVQVAISDWEIECCAPPPAVGAESSWQLEFLATTDELARDHPVTVVHLGSDDVVLRGDCFEAGWSDYVDPPPPPGDRTVRGHLSGTVHGLVPEHVPELTGVVRRVRMLSHVIGPDPARGGVRCALPGTLRMRDVAEAPHWFREPGTTGGDGRRDTGVLIDLEVPAGPDSAEKAPEPIQETEQI